MRTTSANTTATAASTKKSTNEKRICYSLKVIARQSTVQIAPCRAFVVVSSVLVFVLVLFVVRLFALGMVLVVRLASLGDGLGLLGADADDIR